MNADFLQTSGRNPQGYQSGAALRGNWYEIDLGAIRHNYRQLRYHLSRDVKVYACLKRNGYGCGAGPVSSALASEGVHGFAVASILDAMAIRGAGVQNPVLLYPGPLPLSASLIEGLDLTVTVSSIDELKQWRAAIARPRIFIKIDLGFFRAGATPVEAVKLLKTAATLEDVTVEGVYAHMSELPDSGPCEARAQLSRMLDVLQEAARIGLQPKLVMMSSTEGVLNYPDMDFDAVDPGALLIGLPESGRPLRKVELRPALKSICASLVSVKRIDASLGPVPGNSGLADGMTIGVIGMGWGDGLPRQLSPRASGLVRGQRARLLPPAHLEHIRIDLTHIPEARFGDEVVLLGQQGEQSISHEDVASLWGSDLIGLYAGLRDHIPRIYT